MEIMDRTKIAAPIRYTRNGRYIFSHDNPHARRDPALINAIILHQTTFVTQSVTRCDCIIANYVVMPDGTILLIRHPDVALNSIGTDQRAIDIEFVGDYPSSDGLSRGDSRRPPELRQVVSGRDLVRYLKGRYGIAFILAHEQFQTKNCPGPHIWYNVGEWAVSNGLRSSGRGRPVPSAWQDPSLGLPGLPAPVPRLSHRPTATLGPPAPAAGQSVDRGR